MLMAGLRQHVHVTTAAISLMTEAPAVSNTNILRNDLTRLTASANMSASFLSLRLALMSQEINNHAVIRSMQTFCLRTDNLILGAVSLCFSEKPKNEQAVDMVERSYSDLVNLPNAFRRCLPSLIQALKKLKADLDRYGEAIATVVSLFRNILGRLHAISVAKISRKSRNYQAFKCTRSQKEKSFAMSVSRCNGLSAALSGTAMALFDAINLANLSDTELLDGLACIFLDHLGSSLSLIVFADPAAGASKHASLGLLATRGLVNAVEEDQHRARQVAQDEGRYLVQILRSLLLCPLKQECTLGGKSNQLNRRQQFHGARPVLNKTHAMLQHTLLRGVFGEDDLSFRESLHMPEAGQLDPGICMASEELEWSENEFLSAVWTLLGWDILTDIEDIVRT